VDTSTLEPLLTTTPDLRPPCLWQTLTFIPTASPFRIVLNPGKTRFSLLCSSPNPSTSLIFLLAGKSLKLADRACHLGNIFNKEFYLRNRHGEERWTSVSILCWITLQNAPYKDYKLLVLTSFEVTSVTTMDSQEATCSDDGTCWLNEVGVNMQLT